MAALSMLPRSQPHCGGIAQPRRAHLCCELLPSRQIAMPHEGAKSGASSRGITSTTLRGGSGRPSPLGNRAHRRLPPFAGFTRACSDVPEIRSLTRFVEIDVAFFATAIFWGLVVNGTGWFCKPPDAVDHHARRGGLWPSPTHPRVLNSGDPGGRVSPICRTRTPLRLLGLLLEKCQGGCGAAPSPRALAA